MTKLRKEINQELADKLLLSEATYIQIFTYSLRRFMRALRRLHKHRIVLEVEVVVIALLCGLVIGRSF